jgi:hypothetical protein
MSVLLRRNMTTLAPGRRAIAARQAPKEQTMTNPDTINLRSPSPDEVALMLARARQMRAEALAGMANRAWARIRGALGPAPRAADARTS